MAIAPGGEIEALEQIEFGQPREQDLAATWRDVLLEIIASLPAGARKRAAALTIDGTSGTTLACDESLAPAHPPLLYNDARAAEEARTIARAAGDSHPAAAPTSGLAKALWLRKQTGAHHARLFLSQADWLTALLGGFPLKSDYHNALKMGFDVDRLEWPSWVSYLIDVDLLPQVAAPGEALGWMAPTRSRSLGINSECLLRAGTTDSIAALLAAGAREPGEAVTSLGTTLVVKLISETRVDAAKYGIYSHWFGALWLVGGASNAGGGVLRTFFSDRQLAELSLLVDPGRESPLDYYPLVKPGERFPVNDPGLQPRLTPRPASNVAFLHGLLESLARIEARGYRLLEDLGATPMRRVLTSGGGAQNAVWQEIRQRLLGVPVAPAAHHEAAYGAALLALHGPDLLSRKK